MAVQGEETIDIPIFNGLSTSVNVAKKNLCSSMINLIKSGPSELIVREDFILLQTIATAMPAIATTKSVPMSMVQDYAESFIAVGSEIADSPSLLTIVDVNAAAPAVYWLNTNTAVPTSITSTPPANLGFSSFCQFRDRYYGWVKSSTFVYKISNFVAGGGALVMTAVSTAMAGVTMLIAFRNRIFAMAKGRIYYTDLPAIGGYPETWNTVVNFIDLPAVDFDVTIFNAKVYKDKLYLFTDRGIYYLQANGDPINWNIQLVSANFPIFNRDSVAVNRNLIFVTDQQTIYMFDGTQFTNVSQSIQEIFYNFQSDQALIKIYPYEDGIALVRSRYTTGSGSYAQFNESLFYYYDMNIWCAMQPYNISQIIKIGTYLRPYRGKQPSSYIVGLDASSNNIKTFFVDSGKWLGDTNVLPLATAPKISKPISLIGPYVFLESRFFKKLKYWVLYGIINDSVGPINAGTQLSISAAAANAISVPTGNMTPFNTMWRVPFDTASSLKFVASTVGFSLTGSTRADRTDVTGMTSPIVITKVEAIVNLDNTPATEFATQ